MEPKTKQYLLITVVGVTLFVALLRLSSVLAFAAQLVDLVLPILAGGILALFINVPMTGLEKRLKRLFCKAKKQPSDKVLHLLSFFITLLGVVLVLVLALTLLIPELYPLRYFLRRKPQRDDAGLLLQDRKAERCEAAYLQAHTYPRQLPHTGQSAGS